VLKLKHRAHILSAQNQRVREREELVKKKQKHVEKLESPIILVEGNFPLGKK
jgi:hypothetical protein